MKKLSIAVLMLVACAKVVVADVYVSWQAVGGFYWNATPSVGILGSGTGNSTLAQLIWSSDNVAGSANAGTTHYVTGNDVWLADLLITEDGINNDGTTFDSYAWFPSEATTDSGVNPSSGYVYARIFQDNSVDGNDWYYTGNVIAASNLDSSNPLVTPQPYQLNRGGINGDAIDDATFGAQVVPVPEPGTMAMFALGIATLAASRRRRKGVQA